MIMPIAQNPDTGEVRRLDDAGQWVATKTARNPETGETLAFDGNAWVPLKAKPKSGSAFDYANDLVRSVSQGITLGFGDEIAAGGDALLSKVTGDDRPISAIYDANLANERGRLDQFRESNPVTATASEIGGAVGGAVASPVTLGANLMARTGSTLGRMGIGSAMGAGFGGVYGFGAGEGGAESRIRDAAEGAGIGAVAGAAAVPAIDLVSAGVRKATQALLDRFGRTEAGQRKVIDALTKANGGDTRQALAAVKAALNKGDDLTIADVGGINVQRQARAVANVPGEASQIADDLVSARAAGRGDRLRAAADNLAPASNVTAKADALTARARNASRPIYERSVSPDRLIPDEQFGPIAADPYLKRTIEKVRKDTLAGMGDLPQNSMPVVDAAKKQLDDAISVAQRAGENNKVRLLVDKRDKLVTIADDAFPDYAAAREAYGTPTKMKKALEAGQKFLRNETTLTQKELRALSDDEREMFRLGARKAIDDLISSDTQAAITRLGDKKEALWGKIRAVFDDGESFAKFRDGVTQEIDRMRLERFVNPRGGSQTTPLAEDIAELSRVPSWLLDSVEGFKTGGDILGRVGGAMRPLVSGPVNAMRRPDPKVATSIAKTILTMDKKAQDAFFRNAEARAMADEVIPLLQQGYRDALSRALARSAVSQGQ